MYDSHIPAQARTEDGKHTLSGVGRLTVDRSGHAAVHFVCETSQLPAEVQQEFTHPSLPMLNLVEMLINPKLVTFIDKGGAA